MGINFRQPAHPQSAQPLGGRYQIVQQLGAGGFGQTFLARDLHLPEHPLCVIKQLKPQVTTPQEMQIARRLFDTEAKTLHRLGHHPQIPVLLAHFEENNEFYLAQELIEGHSLDDELATATSWSDGQVVTFLGDILSVLAFVHGHQVIHRDLKPSNLIRRQSDNRIVLIDFGAVKQVSTQVAAKSGISHTISIGTQGYMPNEQIAGRPQFSSDVYAAGMIAIQALTGHRPHTIPPHPQTAELDWHSLAPRSHPGLIALLDYMVRYDFRTRYATAAEALSGLQSLPFELSQYIPPLVYATNPGVSAQQTAPPVYPQQSSPSPTQSSPSRSVPTVAVGGRPNQTEAIGAKRRSDLTQGAGHTMPLSTSPRARQPQPAQKMAVPVGIGAAVLLGLGLLTWRACTPAPTTQNATAIPEESPVAEGEPVPTPVVEPATSPSPEASRPTQERSEQESSEQERSNEEVEPTTPPQETPRTDEEVEPPAPPPKAATSDPQAEPTPPDAPAAAKPESTALTPSAAETTVASLYSHVSSQDWSSARSVFGGSLAQQFDPNFFKQFQQVTVENLQVTNQSGDTVELVGQNSYVYPDGRTQREERTYTVQMLNGQPRIVSSSFVRVIKSRND